MSLFSRTAVRVTCVKSVYSWCGVPYFGARNDHAVGTSPTPLSVLSAARA
ncbi:hypothetical protein ACFTSD_05440 [Nocardiaceae bacterium NPDC056970]